MRQRLLSQLVVVVTAGGCVCAPLGVDTARFACASTEDCLPGFECRELGNGRECVRAGSFSDGGADGGFDAGADAGVDAGRPEKLVFTSRAQTVERGTCSAALVVETRDGLDVAAPVDALTPLTLTFDAGADAGVVAFFEAAGCTGSPTTVVNVAAGASTASFFARVEGPGVVEVTVGNPALGSASQPLTVVTPPNALVFTSMVPNPIRAGTCLAASLEARVGAVATPVVTATQAMLTVVPTDAVAFYADSACTQTITGTPFAAGSALSAFFMKPLTGGMATLTATAPFGSAMQSVNVTPMVRRGACDFGTSTPLSDGGTQSATFTSCTITPALTSLPSTFVLVQGVSRLNNGENGAGLVRCRLSSVTQLQCSRRHDADSAQVHYQIVEIPSGLRAQRFNTGCGPTFTLSPPVDPTKTFILKNGIEASGTFDDEEVPVVRLASPTLVEVLNPTCSGLEVQVIEWDGVLVERRLLDGGIDDGGLALSISSLPAAAPQGRALLAQSGTAQDQNREVCATLVRASLPSPTSIDFARALGSSTCVAPALELLYFERLDFGGKARVDEYTATLAPGDLQLAVSITPVDPSRTVVFASSQSAGGQGAGETDDITEDNAGNGTARFLLLNSGAVQVSRARATASARFTFYVVELNP